MKRDNNDYDCPRTRLCSMTLAIAAIVLSKDFEVRSVKFKPLQVLCFLFTFCWCCVFYYIIYFFKFWFLLYQQDGVVVLMRFRDIISVSPLTACFFFLFVFLQKFRVFSVPLYLLQE